ncbi:hypothetical protein B0H17DRAFT_1019889 [Mycena rosella]|uniref:Transmembrane protein n=1 Tax=Mycena rosella TaxID=1033263 RepID=A0AAD7G3S4_MYCRO|nr:hypothetical protein B0H17DRAFT_1019889 [Mycena rosella]
MPMLMLNLEYPLTRHFPGRIFAPTAIGGAIVVLVFLATINAALAGYETITVFDSDFNVTQTHWFHRFLPMQKPKAGTLCDPRLLSLGDTVSTNYTLFQYTIASIDTPNAGDSGFSYKGWTLDNCDITSLYVNGNANTFIIDLTVLVSCRADESQVVQGNDYEVTLRTDWPQSTLAGQYASLLGVQKALKNRGSFNATVDARGKVLDSITSLSSSDFALRVFELDALKNGTFPVIISFQAQFPWCPASLGSDVACALEIPPVNITDMFEYSPVNGMTSYSTSLPTSESNKPLIDTDTSGIIANLVQTVYAAVRIDLGNPSPNNFLLNSSVIPQAIIASFPQTFPQLANESYLYSILVDDDYYKQVPGHDQLSISGLLPLTVPGPAIVDGVYLCHFQRAKSPGSAFIAVLVATLSMFSTGWALFLAFAAGLVKNRAPSANACVPHGSESEDSSCKSPQKEAFILVT